MAELDGTPLGAGWSAWVGNSLAHLSAQRCATGGPVAGGVRFQPAVPLSCGCPIAQAAVQHRIDGRAETSPKNPKRTSQRLGEPESDLRMAGSRQALNLR